VGAATKLLETAAAKFIVSLWRKTPRDMRNSTPIAVPRTKT